MKMNQNINLDTYKKMTSKGIDKTQATLICSINNNAGKREAYVILKRDGTVYQLSKDEVREYITEDRGISGITKTTDNRIVVNMNEKIYFDLIKFKYDDVLASKNEAIRYINDDLVNTMYKGFRSNGKGINQAYIVINNKGEVGLCVQHKTNIKPSKTAKEDYLKYFKRFVPEYLRKRVDPTDEFKIAFNPKNPEEVKLLYTLPIRVNASGYLTMGQVKEIEHLIGLE